MTKEFFARIARGDFAEVAGLIEMLDCIDITSDSPELVFCKKWNDFLIYNQNEMIYELDNYEYSHWRGFTALMVAASFGRADIVEMLLEKGADINAVDSLGLTALMHAIMSDDARTISLLLDAGSPIDSKTHKSCLTQIERGLLAKGNSRTKEDITPLHVAAYTGNAFVIERLVQLGAELNPVGSGAGTPFMLAVRHENWRAIDAFLRLPNLRLVASALKDGKALEFAEQILGNGMESNVRDLLWAAILENNNFVEECLNRNRIRSLIFSLENGLCRFDIRRIDEKGNCFLFVAAKRGDDRLLQYLFEKGIDFSVANNSGLNALMFAVKGKKIYNVRFLLTIINDLDRRDKKGQTALWMAVDNSSPDIVSELLAAGASPDIPDLSGVLPAEMLESRGMRDLTDLFRKSIEDEESDIFQV
jgi:ankyrin repeat protein